MNPPFPYSLVFTNNLFSKESKQMIINICFAFKISDKLWIDTVCNHEKFAGFGQLPPEKNGSKTYWIQRTRQMMDGCYCGPPSWSIEPKILWHASFWLLISPTSALGDKFSMNWCLFRANSQNRSYVLLTYIIFIGKKNRLFIKYFFLKFIYSKKATKFCEFSTLILTITT